MFSIIFAIAFYFSNQLLEINKIKNFILIFILLFFEPDNQFYMETFDPLFLICFFLLFDTKTLNIFFDSDTVVSGSLQEYFRRVLWFRFWLVNKNEYINMVKYPEISTIAQDVTLN